VKAARDGTVLAVYEDDYYGMTVVLEHDGGYTSRYCNLAEIVQVSVGDTVSAGQTIGMIGSTAMIESASESHLHFEVSCNGEPVDPASFLY
jgi:murein DD-endopeptidase MepM/ murein hydrolase activator NlpD